MSRGVIRWIEDAAICSVLGALLVGLQPEIALADLKGRPPGRIVDPFIEAKLQGLLDTYIRERGSIEGVSGAALRVDGGAIPRAIDVFSGTTGLAPYSKLTKNTLFQIGSNTKHFEAALILKLEADGRLKITDPIGVYLPQYPVWKNVTIRSLLNMTSHLPNYSETVAIGGEIARDIHHQFTDQDLIGAVYPGTGFPPHAGFFYSNTNNILAALVVEKVTKLSFKDALQSYLLTPLGLRDTYYEPGRYPKIVLDRQPSGRYENEACLLYQPVPCSRGTLAPLIGRDMRTQNLSWAGAAGAVVSTPDDLAKWVRDLFSLRVFPKKQLDEMTSLVSQKTGAPIGDVSKQDPRGFGLDLGRIYDPRSGDAFWFYQGDTLGFRMAFAYWPQYDVVITGAANSQPPEGQDKFGQTIFYDAFRILTTSRAASAKQ